MYLYNCEIIQLYNYTNIISSNIYYYFRQLYHVDTFSYDTYFFFLISTLQCYSKIHIFLWLMHCYLLVSVENSFAVNTWNVWCHNVLHQVGGDRNNINTISESWIHDSNKHTVTVTMMPSHGKFVSSHSHTIALVTVWRCIRKFYIQQWYSTNHWKRTRN